MLKWMVYFENGRQMSIMGGEGENRGGGYSERRVDVRNRW